MPTPPNPKSKRPPPSRIRLTVSLMPGIDKTLRRLAAADRRSVSQLVQVMLDDGIARRAADAA